MARPLRLEFPGALYHITSRGDGRERIYLDEQDRYTFLAIFGSVCRRLNWGCHAYCLMGNHYHLVVETPEANLARGMRELNGVYSQDFNRRYGRVGHVFQGRYAAIVVDKQAYLLELARYVVLNPVRARLVAAPANWMWSSYGATVAARVRPDWLQTDWLLSQFGTDRQQAIAAYQRFVADGKRSASPWSALTDQIYLGSATFAAEMKARIEARGALEEIPRAQRRQRRALSEYAQCYEQRTEAMAHAFLDGQYTQREIAAFFGVHYSTVSRAVRAVRASARSGAA